MYCQDFGLVGDVPVGATMTGSELLGRAESASGSRPTSAKLKRGRRWLDLVLYGVWRYVVSGCELLAVAERAEEACDV